MSIFSSIMQMYVTNTEMIPRDTKYTEFYVENVDKTRANILSLKKVGNAPTINLEYSYNGYQWNQWTDIYSKGLSFLNRIYLRGDNRSFTTNPIDDGGLNLIDNHNEIKCTNNFNVGGEIASLSNIHQRPTHCIFGWLFFNTTTLINAKDLILSNSNTMHKYAGMFNGCSNLETAPVLDYTERIPDFYYNTMFWKCSKLKEVKAYFTSDPNETVSYYDALANLHTIQRFTNNWLGNTSASGTFYMNKDAKWDRTDVSGTNGWSIKLWDVENDKEYTVIPFYVEDVSGSQNTLTINGGVSLEYSTDNNVWYTWGSNQVTVEPNSRVYLRGINNSLEGSKIQCSGAYNVGGDISTLLNEKGNMKSLTVDNNGCFKRLFQGVTTIKSAEHLIFPFGTLTEDCCYEMFDTSSIEIGPTLPALNLIQGCYRYMFWRASNLRQLKAYFITDISGVTSYTGSWLTGVSPSGVFYKNKDATWVQTDANGTNEGNGWSVVLVDPTTGEPV